MKYRLERAGKIYEIDVQVEAGKDDYVLRGPDGIAQRIGIQERPDGSAHAITPWGDFEVRSARRGNDLFAHVGAQRLSANVQRVRATQAAQGAGASAGSIVAPMAGKLLRLELRVGDVVLAGAPVAVIEAMKMENELLSPLAGVVAEICVSAPCALDKGALIARVEPQ